MIPAFLFGYVALTILFWFGNRNVGRKRPMASAAKWFIWTATWTCLSVMIDGLDTPKLNTDTLLGPVLVAPFVWPMMIVEPKIELPLRIIVLLAPWLAAAIGYVLAVRHNSTTLARNAKAA